MSPEVIFQAVYGDPSFENYDHSLFNANAVPFAYTTESRPHKRIRVAATLLSRVGTNSTEQQYWEKLGSAQSLNGTFPAQQSNVQPEQQESQRPQSVPPQVKRGRKKRSTQNHQDEPWIQESFAFPAQQTWLKVKPRQRKAAVEVEPTEEVAVPASVAPDEGEALSLEKHADRIAALIAQKRRDNDSKLFRERMSLQQRLHRGEADRKDKLIANSHDELKRKMELSARGIFEEQPPSGKEPVLTPDERHPASPHTPGQLSNAPDGEDDGPTDVATFPTPQLLQTGYIGNEASPENIENVSRIDREPAQGEEDESESEEELIPREPFEPPQSQQAAAAIVSSEYLPYEQTTYHQTQTATATQTFVFSDVPHQPQTTQFFLTQPRFTNQRYHNPHLWQPPPEQRAPAQLWTSQMFKALPSTSTPVLETREIATSTQHVSIDEDRTAAFNLFGSSSTSGLYGSYQSSRLLSDDASSAEQPQPAVLRSNVNMFTRQARENGVIGGNNNYFEPGGETGRRRNMFDSRT